MISLNNHSAFLSTIPATRRQRHYASRRDRQRSSAEHLPSAPTAAATNQLSVGFATIAGVIATVALGVSGYLAWSGLTGNQVAGCDGSVFSCEHVLTSKWSKVLGVPVGLPAVALYVSVLGCLVVALRSSRESIRSLASSALMPLSLVAALAAIWFVGLQIFAVGQYCPYCLVAHACAILLAGLMIWRRPLGNAHFARSVTWSILAVGGLVLTQLFTAPAETFVIETHTPATLPANPNESSTDVFLAPSQTQTSEVFEAPIALPESASTNAASTPTASTNAASTPAADQSRGSFDTISLLSSPMFSLIGVMAVPETETDEDGSDATRPDGDRAAENADKGPPRETERRLIPVVGGRHQLDIQQWPLWGDVGATYVVAEMFDYTCSHCQKTHHAMQQASKELKGQLAVIALPVPLSRACNDAASNDSPERAESCEIAKLAIAVWLTDRKLFSQYHDWLFEQRRTASQAFSKATELVGAERLNNQLASGIASQYIAKNVLLYKEAGAGTVPKLMFSNATIVGEVNSGSTIADLVRKNPSR
tara:strand:- start:826718 stop:828331 length:1614 start_codon:yes stop_codon:yes gene_type:complete